VTDRPPPPRGHDDPPRGQLCLITGASGFVGGHLAQRLVAEGYTVRCLVRAESDTSRLEALDVDLALGDLTAPASLTRAVDGCRFVFHCGALVSDWATVEEIKRVNVSGTRALLEACAGSSVTRVVHLSTTDVYGHPGLPGIDETHVGRRFRNWYAQTKLDGEAEVRRVAGETGLDVVILRPATIYGPRSKEVVGEIARALVGGHMLLINGGRAIAGLCYVDNVVDAALLAACSEHAGGQAFNVTDGLAATWRDFTDGLAGGLGCAPARWSLPYWAAQAIGFSLEHGYRILRRTTGIRTKALLSRQAVAVLGIDQDFSNRKLRETLGWEPRTDYATGLAKTVAWLQADQLTS
jgi:nucleoside-diphosphate-sugar epimerase